MSDYLDRRAEMYTKIRMESESHSRMSRIEKLFELSLHDPFVAVHLAQWRKGMYESFEHMLIDLACYQAAHVKSLVDMATLAKQLEPTVILCQHGDMAKAKQIIQDGEEQS
jgi:hypothetical protein